jgi:hypothetical protein
MVLQGHRAYRVLLLAPGRSNRPLASYSWRVAFFIQPHPRVGLKRAQRGEAV